MFVNYISRKLLKQKLLAFKKHLYKTLKLFILVCFLIIMFILPQGEEAKPFFFQKHFLFP